MASRCRCRTLELSLGVVALASLLFAIARWDRAGVHFHPLFQLQLMGLNGVFLTADLFNLFVFFEVMLSASYGLLLHGSGRTRVKAGLHYIAINLAASSLFLVGASMLYAVSGTLDSAAISLNGALRIDFVTAFDSDATTPAGVSFQVTLDGLSGSENGEAFGIYRFGDDEACMPFVTHANVACGFHASDPTVMWKTVRAAKKHGIWPFINMNRTHVVPPCNVTEAELKEGFAALDAALGVADEYTK